MTHAVYLFYAKTDDIDAVVSAFETWIDERGDENNWWMLLCAINSKGESVNLADEGDYRGRDELAEYLLKMSYPVYGGDEGIIVSKIHGHATIEDFKMYAWDIAANEMSYCIPRSYPEYEFLDKIKDHMNKFNSMKELENAILNTSLSAIRKMYSNINFEPKKDPLTSDRRHLVWMFETILECPRLRPFVLYGTPYDFRCFDICDYVSGSKNGETILAVDIHT